VPEIRAFRALRYNRDMVPDLARVVAPPYDVISPAQRAVFAARDPHNVVAIDQPVDLPGASDPDDKYRAAARTFSSWRSDGTLAKDPRPALYVYEQAYTLPGTLVRRIQRGFYARVKLEPFGPGSGILPHERTLSGPREDRHKLMRASGANFSGVMGLYVDDTGDAARALADTTAGSAIADVTDEEGVRHRLWMLPDDGPTAAAVSALREAAGRAPITIADGHHRYETALHYRDERQRTSSNEEDPAFDFVLMLLLETSAGALTVLPAHRVARGIADSAGLLAAAGSLFDLAAADAATLERAFGPGASAPGGAGRFGLWTRAGGAIMTARRDAIAAFLPPGGEALRRLDVTMLAAALEQLSGIDRAATATGGRIAYTKSAAEAIAWVDGAVDGADAAFLLEPTPVAEIVAVAAAGDVMPQKSTYFYPKPLSGFVINPLEW
jgi:uncharacterized protein (DUF1015 family)